MKSIVKTMKNNKKKGKADEQDSFVTLVGKISSLRSLDGNVSSQLHLYLLTNIFIIIITPLFFVFLTTKMLRLFFLSSILCYIFLYILW